ncbi:hypothetical protein [Bacillus sp. JJ722]
MAVKEILLTGERATLFISFFIEDFKRIAAEKRQSSNEKIDLNASKGA